MNKYEKRFRVKPGMTILAVMLLASCTAPKGDWTREEKQLLGAREDVMRVLTVNNQEDSLILRTSCTWLSDEDLQSPEFRNLSEKLVATVTSPEQDGVGIAGPQVGILRRVIAVQRFDKEGEPFEVYPNIAVIETRGETVEGPEGCLSIPGWRGMVPRYRDITIKYTVPETLCDTTEQVTGFTAVIFQHENDHLAGILYTDRATSLSER